MIAGFADDDSGQSFGSIMKMEDEGVSFQNTEKIHSG
jgi:hypothetical protein